MDDDEDRRKRRLRPTMHITEKTEEADTTHCRNETTTIILEATATEIKLEERQMIDLKNATDTPKGDRQHPRTQTEKQ